MESGYYKAACTSAIKPCCGSGFAFLAFRSHTNHRKRRRGDVRGLGTWARWGKIGLRLGGPGVTRGRPRFLLRNLYRCLDPW